MSEVGPAVGPRYLEIEWWLRERTRNSLPGSLLPSEAELAAQFHVSRMTARQALSRIVPTALVKAACRDLERIESEDTEGVKALPGAIELFSAVPEQRRTIVTSSFPDVATARLLAAGIVPPALMITCEQITRGKPDPEPFLAGAALMCVPPDQAIAFEDTRPGIRSAKAAGCTVIAVEGLHRRSELAEADYVVAALTDVRVFNAGDDGFSVEVA